MDEAPQFPRRTITHCSRCRVAAREFAYMQDGRHYCVACARRIRGIIGMRPVGRREGDLRQF